MPILWIKPEDTIDPTGPYTQSAIEMASFILYKLTAEKYTGPQTVTEVYNLDYFSQMSIKPTIIGGGMYNIPDNSSGMRNLRLRHQPVISIASITSFGIPMDPSSYTLRNNAYVVRHNSLPWIIDNIDGIEVTYTHGVNPPSVGRRAAIRFANELILSDMGSSNCALPERISSVSRQGVSYTIMDPQEFISNGKIGIYEVDLFLAATNPNKAKKRPKVFSVDQPRGERITR